MNRKKVALAAVCFEGAAATDACSTHRRLAPVASVPPAGASEIAARAPVGFEICGARIR